MTEELDQLVMEQLTSAQEQHPALELLRYLDGQLRVQGTVGFCLDYEEHVVEDTYEVEIVVPDRYPRVPPTVKETGKAVPDYYHRFAIDGRLCLGAPVEVRRVFAEHKTLLGFINRQVVPYLFNYSCFREFGQLPFGELRHGPRGILCFYEEHFGTDLLATLRLLKYLADFELPQNAPCPCGSHRGLCICHGRKVLELWGLQSPREFAAELVQMLRLLAMVTSPLELPSSTLENLMPKECLSLMESWGGLRKAG